MIDELEAINTCLPAKIVSFDGRIASVQISIPKNLTSDEQLAPPVIYDVPVCLMFGSGNNARITLPIKPGDDVLLFFAQRSTEGWKTGSNHQGMARKFDISDAFAMPLLHPAKTQASTENIEIILNNGKITIEPSGKVSIKGSQCEVDAPTTFKKPVVMQQGLSITGSGEGGQAGVLKGDFIVDGNVSTTGNLNASGNIIATGSVHGSNI